MTTPTYTEEALGRLAVGLPGWQWHPGMLVHFGDWDRPCDHYRMGAGNRGMDTAVPIPGSDWWPDPNDLATAGCLLAMLGPGVKLSWLGRWCVEVDDVVGFGTSIGRASIAAAEALGRWPGGTP